MRRRSGSYKDIATLTESYCQCCKNTRPIQEFYVVRSKWRDRSLIPSTQCKECLRIKGNQYYEKTKQQRSKINNQRRIQRVYNLNQDELWALFIKQNKRCEICEKELNLTALRGYAIDHCHTTGRVRGLLCHSCNAGIGMLKDSINSLENAIKYIRKYEDINTINCSARVN